MFSCYLGQVDVAPTPLAKVVAEYQAAITQVSPSPTEPKPGTVDIVPPIPQSAIQASIVPITPVVPSASSAGDMMIDIPYIGKFDLTQNWPIVGILAIGLFIILKGKKWSSEQPQKKSRGRRRHI